MAVLVEGFTIVVRIEAIEARYPGGWDAFWREAPNESGCCDDDLVAFSFATRPKFRAWLEQLERRGFADARTILDATELSGRCVRPPEEVAPLQARIATTGELALVYRRQPVRPGGLALKEGEWPGTRVVVAGAFLAGGSPGELAVPEGWTVADAVPLRFEPESGDEQLATWHEFLQLLSPKSRDYCLRTGPDAVQALNDLGGGPRLFAGPVRPSPKVIEQETVVRDPDGTERVVIDRWVKP